jgi:hypothetical protein
MTSASCSRRFSRRSFPASAPASTSTARVAIFSTTWSNDVDNLFMAGRNISGTHAALGAVRVQRTTAMIREVVGMAAAPARNHDTSPRGVSEKHPEEFKVVMEKRVGKERNLRRDVITVRTTVVVKPAERP